MLIYFPLKPTLLNKKLGRIAVSEYLANLLAELSALDGLPGHEQSVVRYLKEKFQPLATEISIGTNGNIYALQKGNQPGLTVMVAAHMDEIGLVVRDIDERGMIRFDKLGWFSDSFLPGTRVRINGLPGLISIKPGHLLTEEEKNKVLPHRSLSIDVGANSAEEVKRMGITIGDPIAFDVAFTRWANSNFCCGKALDNRAACAILIALTERLADGNFPGTFWAVGTVQEERGLGGARTAAYFTHPDWFIALDVALSVDNLDQASPSPQVKLGAGVVINLGDFLESAKRGYFINPGLKRLAIQLSKQKNISIQLQALYGNSYTDAAAVAQEFSGIPSISLGIPVRYVHTPSAVCHLQDMEACLDLAEALIRHGLQNKDLAFLPDD